MIKVIPCVQWNNIVEQNIESSVRCACAHIGIPKDATYPNGVSVESVAFVQEFGNGSVPPRPFVRNTIVEKKDEWKESVREKLSEVARGKTHGSSETALKAVGEEVKADIIKGIENIVDPPLKPSTVERKRAKGRKHPEKPMVDTGKMKSSFTVEVT